MLASGGHSTRKLCRDSLLSISTGSSGVSETSNARNFLYPRKVESCYFHQANKSELNIHSINYTII